MGSTLAGSVRLSRFRAEREMYCVVPWGARTLVFGSASKEYRHVYFYHRERESKNDKTNSYLHGMHDTYILKEK